MAKFVLYNLLNSKPRPYHFHKALNMRKNKETFSIVAIRTIETSKYRTKALKLLTP